MFFSHVISMSYPRHIQTKISNKLSSKTTENCVQVYLNSKMASTVSDAEWLNVSISFRCLLGIMKMRRSKRLALCTAWPGLVRLKPSDP